MTINIVLNGMRKTTEPSEKFMMYVVRNVKRRYLTTSADKRYIIYEVHIVEICDNEIRLQIKSFLPKRPNDLILSDFYKSHISDSTFNQTLHQTTALSFKTK